MSKIEAAHRVYRLLNGRDTWGSSWVANEFKGGAKNPDATATGNLSNWLSHRLTQEQPWFVTNTPGPFTLPGSNGSTYRPAEGLVVAIWSVSDDVTTLQVRDYYGGIGVIGLTSSAGVIPVYLTAQRTATFNDTATIYVAFAPDSRIGFKAPVLA